MSVSSVDHLAEITVRTGVKVERCYQCGKCSAGCAVNREMDYPPSVVMRMLQAGRAEDFDALLRSETIWLCASCQNCLERCPMRIDIPALMDHLREKALGLGVVNRNAKNIVSFHRAFLDSVRYTGRLYEIGLVADYKLRSFKLMQDLDVAPSMFMKGKLPLMPEVIKDRSRIAKIFSRTADSGKDGQNK